MIEKILIISCPHCKTEYLPAEIYLPESFLGKPEDIEREQSTGKICNYFGSNMDLEESYICDRCGQPFKVKAKVQFSTEGVDFRKEYSTKLKKHSLFLEED